MVELQKLFLTAYVAGKKNTTEKNQLYLPVISDNKSSNIK